MGSVESQVCLTSPTPGASDSPTSSTPTKVTTSPPPNPSASDVNTNKPASATPSTTPKSTACGAEPAHENDEKFVDENRKPDMDEFAQLRTLLERLDDQSYTIREIAKVLTEHNISISRMTRRTQEVLVAVALSGTY